MRRAVATALAMALGAVGLAACGDGGKSPEEAFRAYVDAINRHDGAAVCQAIDPAGWSRLRPPVKRESCAEGVTASIGHQNAKGQAWAGATIHGSPSEERHGDSAVLHVKISDNVALRRTRSAVTAGGQVVDETVRMRKSGDTWLLLEPDMTLYFAIGQR